MTPAQAAYAKVMPEAELEENVRDACKHLRLLRYHTLRPKGSPAGFPDDCIVGPGGLLFRELKRHGKNPTPEQEAWLYALAEQGVNVGVWRPEDWFTGRIMEELQAVAPQGPRPYPRSP